MGWFYIHLYNAPPPTHRPNLHDLKFFSWAQTHCGVCLTISTAILVHLGVWSIRHHVAHKTVILWKKVPEKWWSSKYSCQVTYRVNRIRVSLRLWDFDWLKLLREMKVWNMFSMLKLPSHLFGLCGVSVLLYMTLSVFIPDKSTTTNNLL